METIFYILIYLSSVCDGGYYLETFTNNSYQMSCNRSEATVEIVSSIDSIVAEKNQTIGQLMYMVPKEPDKIIKVTMKNGKIIGEKQVYIGAVKERVKKTVETYEDKIVRYEVKE